MLDLVRKSFIPNVSLKADTPGAISVEFATLKVIDHDNDVTLPGAFGKQGVRMQPFGHDTRQFSIGKGTISESGDKAIFDGLINLDMQAGKDAHSSLKFDLEHGDPLQEWSYIFEILDADFGEHEGHQVRFLKRLKVHSVDPVFLGAGLGTRTTGVKGLVDLPFSEFLEQADALVTELSERAKAYFDMRSKEGRTFSAANLARLHSIADSLGVGTADLVKLLEEADPKAADLPSELLKERLRFERLIYAR